MVENDHSVVGGGGGGRGQVDRGQFCGGTLVDLAVKMFLFCAVVVNHVPYLTRCQVIVLNAVIDLAILRFGS